MTSRSEIVGSARTTSVAVRIVRADYVLFVLGALIWRLALDLAYVFLLFPLNEYFGFRYAPDTVRLLESYVLTVLAALALPARTRQPSTYILYVFYALAIVPILSYFALGGEPRSFLYTLLVGYVVLICAIRLIPPLTVPPLRGRGGLAIAVMSMMVLIAVGSLLARVGLGGLNVDLTRVYEFREGATADLYAGAWAYLYSWVGGTIIVTLMIYLVTLRKYGLACLALLCQLFMFAATSHKVYLFQPVIALGTYWLLSRTAWRSLLIWCLVAAIVGAMAAFSFLELDVVGDLIVRRTMYVPAFLDFRYVEFFSANPKVALSNSVFAAIGEYPYGDHATGMVIGNYIGFPDVNAVTGYLGTAFMNFGAAGIVVYSVIIAVLLRLLDGCVLSGLPSIFVASVAIGPMRAVLTESDLFTTLLTHGLGMLLVLLLMLVPGRRKPGNATLAGLPVTS